MRGLWCVPEFNEGSVVINIVLIAFIKSLLIAAAIALLYFFRIYDRGVVPQMKWWLNGLLAVVAILSAAAYADFGHYPKFGSFLNPHDFFHYYLGAKYSDEVGYTDLYNAVLTADTENNNNVPRFRSVRSQGNYNFVPAAAVLAKRADHKALFSDERWETFKHDVAYFQQRMAGERWSASLRDKGYNATPTWNLIAKPIANAVPVESIELIMFVDLALLAIMLGAVAWAFGPRNAVFLFIFFCTLFPMSYTHIRGAFLRLDWVTMLVMAACFLKKERYAPAGVLAAYAAGARIFPVVFAFGLGAKALVALIRTRTIPGTYFRFFLAFGVTLVLLLGASVIADGGIAHWQAFFTKMELHDGDLSPVRVGFKYLFLDTYQNTFGSWGPFESAKLALFEERKVWWWGIQAVMLAVVFGLSLRVKDYETVALGYIPAFFLFAPTFYYHVMLLVPALFFLPRVQMPMRAFGMTLFFGLSIALYGLDRIWALDLKLSYTMAALLLGLVIYMGLCALLSKPDPAAPAPPPKRAGAPEAA
jgi:hypothetical protein